jgi:hypothetical protein
MLPTDDDPADENGNVLRRMKNDGDNLSLARDIDFTVVLPTEINAQEFSQHFQGLGYRVTAKLSECVPALPWDVVVVKNMVPGHTDITSFEEELGRKAADFGGRNDGWGCFAM